MAKNEKIVYESDIEDVVRAPSGGASGNIAVFGDGGTIEDGGCKPSDFVTNETVDQKVEKAYEDIWDAVKNEYALGAYKSDDWASGTEYEEGDFCIRLGEGYRCNEDHTSGVTFDASLWTKVLTSSGKSAIDSIVSSITISGGAKLSDIAPAYNGNKDYSVNQLAVKNGVLQICTVAGRGPAATFSTDATVEKAIEDRFAALVIPTKVSDLEDDSGHLDQSALDAEYDTSSGEYAVGDTCTHGGKFYKCVNRVLQDAAWNASDWDEITFKAFVKSGALQQHADWAENDSSKPGFIRNKPNIPAGMEIDKTLTVEGDAADAKAVGDALALKANASAVNAALALKADTSTVNAALALKADKTQIVAPVAPSTSASDAGKPADAKATGDALALKANASDLAGKIGMENLPYKVEILSEIESDDPTKVKFQLKDRTVNVVNKTMSGNIDEIVLLPPASIESQFGNEYQFSRDFYVVLEITTDESVSVSLSGTSLKDYEGASVTLSAPAGSPQRVVYRFTEISTSGQIFLVTCRGDAAYRMIKEIEKALDDILESAGEMPDFTKGLYVEDEYGLYHKLTAVYDPELGQYDLGIEQEGVELGALGQSGSQGETNDSSDPGDS